MSQGNAGRAAILLSVSGTLLIVGCLVAHVPIGSEPGRWSYPYFRDFSFCLLWPAAAASALGLAIVWASQRLHQRHPRSAVTLVLALGLAAQLVLRWYSPASFDAIVSSDAANSFYSVAQRLSASELLRSSASNHGILIGHAAANMPGKVVLYYVLEQLTNSPAAMALAIVVLSNFGGVFLYLAVREIFRDNTTALYSVILYMFVPGRIYFSPILNTISPTLILLCFFLFARFLNGQGTAVAVALGVALYGLVFFEPLPLAMGLLFVAYLGTAFFRDPASSWPMAMKLAIGASAGFAMTYAAMALVLDYDLFESFRRVLADARSFNAWIGRPYRIWVFGNLFEFALTAGAALIAFVPFAYLRTSRSGGIWHEWVSQPVVPWTTSIVAVLVVLDVGGLSRGEVARLWLFLACFLPVVPANLLARGKNAVGLAIVTCSLMLQAAVGVGMVAFVEL